MATDFAKVSVSLPSPLVERIKQKAGARGVSGYGAPMPLSRRNAARRFVDGLRTKTDGTAPFPTK